MASLGLLLSIVFPSVFSAPVVATSPPPPPPSPPGIGCSGEQVFTTSSGSASVTFTAGGQQGRSALVCTFLIHTTAPSGLTLSFSAFQLNSNTANEPCKASDAYIRVYDGTTKLARMLASYTCTTSWSVGSTGSSILLYFKEDGLHSGSFTFSWQPSSNVCGNGVCEASSDEYDTCLADCVSSRPGALPALSLQHSDTKCVRAESRYSPPHDVSHNAPSPSRSPSRTPQANPPVPPGASTGGAPTTIG